MYAKAHPFGYIKRKVNKDKRVQCRNTQCTRVQTIYMADGSIKNIFHVDNSYKKGYTLAEAVYNSIFLFNHKEIWERQFRKRER